MRKLRFVFILFLYLALLSPITFGQELIERSTIVELLREKGFSDKLDKGVRIESYDDDLLCVFDEGDFFYQYLIQGEACGREFNITNNVSSIRDRYDGVIVVTHGWVDEGYKSWPWDMIRAIHAKAARGKWLCVAFDWRDGSGVVNPIDAAKYAKYIAGPRLAKSLQSLGVDYGHIHLIGHSAGSWVIDSAARILADSKKTDMHLTFLDAFVPNGWHEEKLGKIKPKGKLWVDHYYTRDYTLGTTQKKIPSACNVDLTKIEPGVKEHRFPFRWYFATITGKYEMDDRETGVKLYNRFKAMDMGYPRSKEFSLYAWNQSLNLGHIDIVLKKKAKDTPFIGWLKRLFN